MAGNYYKPQSPLEQNGDYIYPLSTSDQIIHGEKRLDTVLEETQTSLEDAQNSLETVREELDSFSLPADLVRTADLASFLRVVSFDSSTGTLTTATGVEA